MSASARENPWPERERSLFKIGNKAFLLCTAMLLSLPLKANAADTSSSFSASVAPSFFSGTFGTTHTTDIYYVPIYLEYKDDPVALKLTLPYISVRSNGAVVAGGTVIGKGTGTTVTTNSGLGDIWLEGKYTVHDAFKMVDLIPYAKIKFGTASRSKGLGTGQEDLEFGVGVRTRIGARAFPFARVGYRIVGSPANTTLNNIMTYKAGVSYAFNNTNVFTVLFSGRQASQPGFQAAADLITAWNYKLRPDIELQAFGDIGLSNGSPDYGAGINATVRL